jgi:hypothetical protein
VLVIKSETVHGEAVGCIAWLDLGTITSVWIKDKMLSLLNGYDSPLASFASQFYEAAYRAIMRRSAVNANLVALVTDNLSDWFVHIRSLRHGEFNLLNVAGRKMPSILSRNRR